MEQAVLANPNDLYVLAAAGVMNIHCGTLDRAMEYFRHALRVGPTDPLSRFSLTGSAHTQILLGNFEEALDFAAQALAVNDRFDATYWMLAAAKAHLGRAAKARFWLEELLARAPKTTVAVIVSGQPARYPDRFAAIAKGLTLAGMPES